MLFYLVLSRGTHLADKFFLTQCISQNVIYQFGWYPISFNSFSQFQSVIFEDDIMHFHSRFGVVADHYADHHKHSQQNLNSLVCLAKVQNKREELHVCSEIQHEFLCFHTCSCEVLYRYSNRFATQYITYLNIWRALSRSVSLQSTHDRLI